MSENRKTCSICNVEYPATTEYFNPKKGYKFGFSCWCKDCEHNKQVEYARKRGAKPKEIIRKDGMRKCPRCQEWKLLTVEFFYTNTAAWDGFHNYCIPCTNAMHNETNQKQGRKPRPVRVSGDNKQCTKCEQWFPATNEYFGKRSNQPDGLNYYCKPCNKIFSKISRVKKREYYKEYHVTYRAKNKQSIRQRQQEWEDRNRPHVRLKKVVSENRRRAKKVELLSNLSNHDWNIALEYFGYQCAICGRPRGLWHTLAMDHWQPLSKGGDTIAENIIPMCHGDNGCNNSKGATPPLEWLSKKFGKRKAKEIAQRIETYFEWVKQRKAA